MLLRDRASASPRKFTTFPLLFLALFFAFQACYQSARDTRVVRVLIDELTVAPSARLISWLTPDEGVVAQGHRLVSPHARLSVLNGCEGTDVMLMLAAAMLAFNTMGWRRRLLGIMAGAIVVYLANQTRIVTLYYSLRFDRSLFEALHGYVAPIAVIAVAGLFFMRWISHGEPDRIG